MQIKIQLILTLLVSSLAIAQTASNFGKLTNQEKTFSNYAEDPSANAVVLYEKGTNYFEIINQRIQLVKIYHAKIKILNEEGFDEADISIGYYHNKNAKEIVKDIKAVTHNDGNKIFVSQSNIFTNDLSERVSEKRFTFSDVKQGSIIEYQYK